MPSDVYISKLYKIILTMCIIFAFSWLCLATNYNTVQSASASSSKIKQSNAIIDQIGDYPAPKTLNRNKV